MSPHMRSAARVCMLSRLARPGLGDLIQRNIFLNLMRRAFPQARLTWIVGERITASSVRDELLRRHTWADEVITCPDAEDDDAARWAGFVTGMADRRFDACVLDPSNVGVNAQDVAGAGVPVRIGLPRGDEDDQFLTRRMRLSAPVFGRPDLYDYTVALARALGIEEPLAAAEIVPRLPLRVEPAPKFTERRPLVGIHPGGAKAWNRRWPLSRYIELCVRLVAEKDATIVVLGSADEADEVDRLRSAVLARRASAQVHPSVGSSLNSVANLIDRMDLLVGNDSSLAHIAAALRTPTVVVYGPTGTEFLWARIYPVHRGVNKRYPCQHRRLDPVDEAVPCAYACPCAFVSPDGPYPRCLIDISVDEVYEKVHAQLGPEPRAELDPTPSSID